MLLALIAILVSAGMSLSAQQVISGCVTSEVAGEGGTSNRCQRSACQQPEPLYKRCCD